MSDIIKLKQDILKNGSLNDEFRKKIDMLDEDIALNLFTEIIEEHNEHKNIFLLVQFSDEIVKRKATKCLDTLLNLKKQKKLFNTSEVQRNRLEMNIELLDLEANTDIDRIECPCGIYIKYKVHPESYPHFKILSKKDMGGGVVVYDVYKAKCIHCASVYKIEIQELSFNKVEISWSLDMDDD